MLRSTTKVGRRFIAMISCASLICWPERASPNTIITKIFFFSAPQSNFDLTKSAIYRTFLFPDVSLIENRVNFVPAIQRRSFISQFRFNEHAYRYVRPR